MATSPVDVLPPKMSHSVPVHTWAPGTLAVGAPVELRVVQVLLEGLKDVMRFVLAKFEFKVPPKLSIRVPVQIEMASVLETAPPL